MHAGSHQSWLVLKVQEDLWRLCLHVPYVEASLKELVLQRVGVEHVPKTG